MAVAPAPSADCVVLLLACREELGISFIRLKYPMGYVCIDKFRENYFSSIKSSRILENTIKSFRL
jgi:hypothetical protein